jgi:hypothetical protein
MLQMHIFCRVDGFAVRAFNHPMNRRGVSICHVLERADGRAVHPTISDKYDNASPAAARDMGHGPYNFIFA